MSACKVTEVVLGWYLVALRYHFRQFPPSLPVSAPVVTISPYM